MGKHTKKNIPEKNLDIQSYILKSTIAPFIVSIIYLFLFVHFFMKGQLIPGFLFFLQFIFLFFSGPFIWILIFRKRYVKNRMFPRNTDKIRLLTEFALALITCISICIAFNYSDPQQYLVIHRTSKEELKNINGQNFYELGTLYARDVKEVVYDEMYSNQQNSELFIIDDTINKDSKTYVIPTTTPQTSDTFFKFMIELGLNFCVGFFTTLIIPVIYLEYERSKHEAKNSVSEAT
ncbi:hypothetical protein [Enterococcus sp. AZ163]|uniref:hypothetical protein n=1 Tax=Enterococcus sp. AZ163 TaxID=2774638 RepID=UPI003D2A2026